ncbi:MAG TPA: hypothetical protein VLC98_11535 [Phnomibacter sp.]|nr:hypothetical protein [Phnomibacter sp.]
MKKNIKYCVLAMLWPLVSIQAQKTPIKALGIGDVLPRVTSSQVLFYPKPSISTRDFPGKLLILDLFHTACGSCVQKLARYDSLQRQFAEKLQIVLVTTQPKTEVQAIWAKNQFTKNVHLPLIASDSLLQQYFPHFIISHEVWIGADGRVAAITGTDYVKQSFIEEALRGNAGRWPIKKDIEDFEEELPILNYNAGQPNQLQPQRILYSAFWDAMDGMAGRLLVKKDSQNNVLRTRMINMAPITYYLASVGWFLKEDIVNRVIWETKRREELDPAASSLPISAWMARYSKCYESVQPLEGSGQSRFNHLRQNLNNYLGLYVRMEKRPTACWLLQRIPGTDVLSPVSATQKYEIKLPGTDSVLHVKTAGLLYALNMVAGNLPVLDSTGLQQLIRFPAIRKQDFANIPLVNQLLNPYGLQLVQSEQPIDLLVISDAQ